MSFGKRKLWHDAAMKLYVAPMDAVIVDARPDGTVRFENEDWSTPTLQERRAIIYAAQDEVEALQALLEALGADPQPSRST
jgi:hypothetical protein